MSAGVQLDFSKAQPIDQPPPAWQQPGSAPSSGVSLDFTKAQPINPEQMPTSQPSQPSIGQISAVPQPTTVMGKLARWIDNVSNDLKYGTDTTGVGTVLKKMGAHGVFAGNPEAVGDFMASLPLGLLKAGKAGTELTPEIVGGPKGKTWQGVKDLVGGGLQAMTMPGAFVAPEAGEVASEALGTAGEAAARVPKAIANTVSAKNVQTGLQGAAREIVNDVADKAGVSAPNSKSLLGAIEETGDNIHALSKTQYRQLDEASGGTWQRYDTKLQAIRQRMSRLDPDLDSEQWEDLETKKTETEIAQHDTIDQLISEGKITKELANEARSNYKQANALWDTKAALKPAIKGANPDVIAASKNPELADPEHFFRRVDKLHDSGRLQDALGQENADKLYRTANDSVVRYRQVMRNQKIAKAAGGTLGTGTALNAARTYFQNKLPTQ